MTADADADAFDGLNDALDPPLLAVAKLALLPRLKYDQQREAEAKRLGVRVATLDAEVAAARGEGAAAETGQVRKLHIARPEPWPEKVDGAEILDCISQFLVRHVFLPAGAADALAAWALHTHAFDRFRHSPRVAFTSPEKRCGKTTALDALALLMAAPLPTANITSAALFRSVEVAKPTLLIDEADTFLRDNEDLRGAINAGHKRGGQVIRCVGDDSEPRAFSVFSPAAIAAIGRLPGTIEDRSIMVRMQRATRAERPAPFDEAAEAAGSRLARMCAGWVADHAAALAEAVPTLPPALFNRTADNWRPLFAIAEVAGGCWPARLAAASAALAPADDDEGRGVRLLGDIRTVFIEKQAERLASVDLIAALLAIEAAPWSEANHGRPITPHLLARLLRGFGVHPALRRVGADVFRGYERAAFAEAFARYLPTPAEEGGGEALHRYSPQKTAENGAQQVLHAESPVTLPENEKPQKTATCNGVTLPAPDVGGAAPMWETAP